MKRTNKILLCSLITMFLTGALLLCNYYNSLRKQFGKSFDQRATEVTSDISSLLRGFIVTGNTSPAYNYVEQIAQKRHIVFFRVNVTGVPADFGRAISRQIPPLEDADFKEIGNGLSKYDNAKQKICYYRQDVFFDASGKYKAAEVIMGFSYKDLNKQLNMLQIKFGALIFLLLFVLFMIFVWAKRSYGKIYSLFLDYFSAISQGKEAELPKHVSDFAPVLNRAHEMAKEMADYQKKLAEQAHLAAIGQSTAMVAHDVRRPLSSMKVMLGSLPAIKDDPVKLERIKASVDASITHTENMLNEIMDFSRDSTALELKEHDPQSIIIAAIGEVLRNHPNTSALSIEYDLQHRHTLHVDCVRTIRVLTNIMNNALGAMTLESGKVSGSLWISTCEIERGERRYISIRIGDSGPGIAEDVIGKVFDPFFTHGKKGGTGLGLAICKKIVDMHSGSIRVENRVPARNGAQFTIELPSGEERVEINKAELIYNAEELKTFREEETGREEYGDTANTVEFMKIHKEMGRPLYLLVVDDEPLFRETVRSLLNTISQVKDHVKVVESGSAEEALNLFNAREFDYVIADIDLGKRKMNGYEMSEIMLEKYPNTYILIHSNKRKEEMDRNIREIKSDHFMGFLPKPMKQSELLQFLACKTFEVTKIAKSSAVPAKKMLIVNDDPDLLLSFKIILKSPSLQVLGASNVSEALEHLTKDHVDIILSDINLGADEPDGYEFLKKVREKDKSIPFYLISGYSRRDEEPKAMKLGANGYLQLPVEKDQLMEILQ